MPVEQRIIGGGLLIGGVAVVLILLYLFTWGGLSPQEAHDKLINEVYPAFVQAETDGDYLALKRRAQEASDVLDDGGRAGIVKILRSDASTGNRDAKRLLDLPKKKSFERNSEGRFGFDDGWYEESIHRALVRTNKGVEEMKLLRKVRDTATEARKAVDEARTGSGLPLELPAAKLVPRDDAPIVDPNPIYVNDAELYRVFGLKPADMVQALATAAESSKGRSARLRWNKNVVTSNLAKDIPALPDWAQSLRRMAVDIERGARDLEGRESARKALAKLLAEGARHLGRGIAPAQRAVFDENLSRFEQGAAIATVLRREAEMLEAYQVTVRDLGLTFAQPFVK
jgi:hypothetical protein